MNSKWQNKVVALTGGIGCGKSSVAAMFHRWGAFVVHADLLARQTLQDKSPAHQEVVDAFGDEILTSEGQIDRHRLGTIIFSDSEKREILNQIVHPLIAIQAESLFTKTVPNHYTLLVYDVPLFFETGMDQHGYRSIITVISKEQITANRIQIRDGLSEDKALLRIRSQLSVFEKARRADFVIRNNTSKEDLELHAREVFESLRQDIPDSVA